ncbi:unnamed protein product [Enterobius vermicularis]|uniref:MSP domain-containing protein n=1 Tax=Enterobius vermicularis TaxID=51028 RepID=A0A0N4VJH9_ENTVE|nr:unnamed protein product [Enterobius vermicularis]
MKPLSKKASPFAQFDFNLTILPANSATTSTKLYCRTFCFYPYIKVNISNDQESFRSQKWCGTLVNVPISHIN